MGFETRDGLGKSLEGSALAISALTTTLIIEAKAISYNREPQTLNALSLHMITQVVASSASLSAPLPTRPYKELLSRDEI